MNKLRQVSIIFISVLLMAATKSQADEKSRLITNLEAGKKQKIVAYGTSLTKCGAWVQQLDTILNQRYPGKVTVLNKGKPGMWSKWGVDNLEERVIKNDPDTVFIEFAMNDAYLPYETSVEKARDNLENIITRIERANPACEIILMVMNPPIGKHLEQRPKIKDYYEMYREVAADRQFLLIDHYPNWEKILTENPELFNEYVPDGIHPGEAGCEAVITPEIIKSLGISATE